MSNGINPQKKPIRVAFLLIGGQHWMGGYNYLVNLLHILEMKTDEIEPILFLGNDLDDAMLDPLQKMNFKIMRDNHFNMSDSNRLILKSMFFGKSKSVEQILINNKIDVVFEAVTYLGWRMKVPSLAWIPDFQHKHLGHMFSMFGKFKRDFLYWIISKSRTVMLSSFDAQKDFSKYYNSNVNNSRVVSFVVKTPHIEDSTLKIITQKYAIEYPYFYLPNQYWVHKNHKVVIEALHILKEQGKDIVVVSSGACQDKRNSSHCSIIEDLVKKYKLEEHYIMLGSIPYKDVLQLGKYSCAIINPSYFEGWSTTVEEAKSLDIPLILSDLNVHKEQVGTKGLYFSPDSPNELANILANFSCEGEAFTYGLNEEDKRNEYANSFIKALEFTIDNFKEKNLL